MALAQRRIVVVGLGVIGRRHARLLARRAEATGDLSVELCDANEASLADATSGIGPVRTFTSFDEALRSSPDMLLIATPHDRHADQTIAALRAGCHVLCEKPMSHALPDARRMQQAAEKHSDRVLAFGFNLHFHSGLRRLKQLIDAGELGAVVHAHCHVGTYQTLVNSRSRYQASMEGALLFDYVHQPDAMYWMLRKRPRRVFMAGAKGGQLELTSNPNVLAITCEYDDASPSVPMISTIHLNYVQMPERHHYEIIGDRGWATFDLNKGEARFGRRADASEYIEQVPTERDSMYEAEHQAFFDAIEGRRPPESPAGDAIVSLEVMDAALRSWRDGRSAELAT